MTTNAVVLGAGIVGSVIAEDLAQSGFSVKIADIDGVALARISERSNQTIAIAEADCSDQSLVASLCEEADIVLGALPSWLGFQALRTIIESKTPCCDISFMAEDPRQFDQLARDNGVTCVVDFGVAPGMSHLLCAVAVAKLDKCRRLDIVVGGLPLERSWPWEYKASFSPRDVIEQYLRPARLVENNRTVVREALSECVQMDLPGVGTLEAFNSDGLRTLCDTLDVPFMRERTLRYPGHAQLMRVLKAGGFFKNEEIQVGGSAVKPIDVTSTILIDGWKYDEGEADLTVMRVEAEGRLGDEEVVLRWDLLDYYDAAAGQSSMARTTGFPAASIGRMIADGTIDRPGVHPPETFGDAEEIVLRLMSELESRDVRFIRTMEPVQ